MNTENKLAKLMRNSGPARTFVPAGIIILIFGIFMLGMKTDTFEETVGYVTSVEEHTNDEKQKEYDVTFTYTAGGQEREGVFADMPEAYSVGQEIPVFYDPENPEKITNSKGGSLLGLILVILGAAAIAAGILRTVTAFKKSAELEKNVSGSASGASAKTAPAASFAGYKEAPGVAEIYCRHDGKALKPGYIIEDKDRKVLFEAKMLKNNPVGPLIYEFTDHTTGSSEEHEVGHVTTETFNNEFFSVSSWFKFEGRNIWDVLHDKGLRFTTDLRSKFPYVFYDVTRNGAPFARIESSSIYVHEEDEAQHKVVVPYGKYYYRIWTDTRDLETLFLAIFAVSETEQTFVE